MGAWMAPALKLRRIAVAGAFLFYFNFGYHFFTCSSAHWGVLSEWQLLQLLGSPFLIVSAGEMKLNVWLRASAATEFSPVLGIWHSMHRLPVLSGSWCV